MRGGLKTKSSRPSLRMPQAVIGALTEWRAEQLTQQLACPAWEDHGLVFTYGSAARSAGRRSTTPSASYAGPQGSPDLTGPPFQPRELRHTFTSLLSDAGVDIEVISDSLGHVNSREQGGRPVIGQPGAHRPGRGASP